MPEILQICSGDKYGMLTIVKEVESKINSSGREIRCFLCKCDCGKEKVVPMNNLRSGNTKSCGCMRDRIRCKHGESNTRLYRIWASMVQRCTNPHDLAYKYYGGRGIKVCVEWVKDFSAFRYWALSTGYNPEAPQGKTTIDRIDVNGDYAPSNCRWVTMKMQSRNKRNNRIITYQGISKTLIEWSEYTGISVGTIRERLRKGAPLDTLFSKERIEINTRAHEVEQQKDLIISLYRQGRTKADISRCTGVSVGTINRLFKRHGVEEDDRPKGAYKRVLHYDENGEFIESFWSTAEAAKAVGLAQSMISMYCKGLYNPKNKHIWKYE